MSYNTMEGWTNTPNNFCCWYSVILITWFRFLNLLKDANSKNLFHFDQTLCEEATLSKDKMKASIEGHSEDCILLAHRGMTSGCYTWKGTFRISLRLIHDWYVVRIDGQSEGFPFILGLGVRWFNTACFRQQEHPFFPPIRLSYEQRLVLPTTPSR